MNRALVLPADLPALQVPPAYLPRVVALTIGDRIIAALGARSTALSLVAWTAAGEARVRTYPTVERATWSEESNRREAAGEADAIWDVMSRIPAGRPLQLVASAGSLWLVRENGHTRIDPETLEMTIVPRSETRYLVPADDETITIGPAGLRRCSADDLLGPVYRNRGNIGSLHWELGGRDVQPARPLQHLLAGLVHGGRLLLVGYEDRGRGWYDPELVVTDLTTGALVRRRKLPTVRAENVEPLEIWRLADRLFLTSLAALNPIDGDGDDAGAPLTWPRGFAPVGHDEQCVILLSRRARALARIGADALTDQSTLAAAIAAAFARPPAQGRQRSGGS